MALTWQETVFKIYFLTNEFYENQKLQYLYITPKYERGEGQYSAGQYVRVRVELNLYQPLWCKFRDVER